MVKQIYLYGLPRRTNCTARLVGSKLETTFYSSLFPADEPISNHLNLPSCRCNSFIFRLVGFGVCSGSCVKTSISLVRFGACSGFCIGFASFDVLTLVRVCFLSVRWLLLRRGGASLTNTFISKMDTNTLDSAHRAPHDGGERDQPTTHDK